MLRKINQLRIKSQKKNQNKGQTALEYALVVGAISLTIMFGWNLIGKDVVEALKGDMRTTIKDNLLKGNGSIKQ